MTLTDPDTPRTRFIEHDGESILLLDYSGIYATDEALHEIELTTQIIAQQPPASLRTLTYVKGARYNPEIIEALKQLVAHNKPYVFAAAVVGMSTLHRIIYRAILSFTRRNIEVFDELEPAKRWLASQQPDMASTEATS